MKFDAHAAEANANGMMARRTATTIVKLPELSDRYPAARK
jgi:hypothetical protein